MLKAITNVDAVILNVEDYSITEKYDGLDILEFSISITDDGYRSIYEETPIIEEQRYLVKAIDAGKISATVKCQLDLDELKADMHIAYSNGSDTLVSTLEHVIPNGWVVVDKAYLSIRRTVELDAATTYDIIDACRKTYGAVFRFDNQARTITILEPSQNTPLGAFVTRELNLTELNYMGQSTGFATRLYAYGKDGLSFADINDGLPYVDDHTYTDKIVSAYWKDERYTVVENLLADAKKKLTSMAVPQRSYTCSVVDLAKTNPGTYNFLAFALYDVVTLIDLEHEARVDHMVMEYKRYPNYPEKNMITLSTVAPSIQNTVVNLQEQIENPTSDFREHLQAVIDSATEAISGQNGGNYRITTNAQGQPNGFVIMDTNDIATAVNCMRVNLSGIGFSHNGFNGPYDSAWTLDGTFYADFITAGSLTANLIKSGKIQGVANPNVYFDLDNGVISANTLVADDGNAKLIVGRTIESQDYVYGLDFKDANGDSMFSINDNTANVSLSVNSDFFIEAYHAGSAFIQMSNGNIRLANNYYTSGVSPKSIMFGDFTMEYGSTELWGYGPITLKSRQLKDDILTAGFTEQASIEIAEKVTIKNADIDLSGYSLISCENFGNLTHFRLNTKPDGSKYMEIITTDGDSYGLDAWLSDISLKRDIIPCESSALDVISRIPVRSFDYKAGGHRTFGVIAQELLDSYPDGVMEVDQPDGGILLQPKSSGLIPLLLKAVQELREENRKLREEFEQLKSEVNL